MDEASSPILLTDGGIETELIYTYRYPLPDFASFLPLFDERGRAILGELYASYLAVAAEFSLPMQIGTPTWRAHPDGLARQGFSAPSDLERVNRAAVELLQGIRREMGVEGQVTIAGVIGPRFDGYDPAGAPDAAAAEAYHSSQADILAKCGVDSLYAPTFASVEELLGIARAMAATALPYALAPVVDRTGRLLDGTPLGEAVRRVDAGVPRRPAHFLIGCVHPSRFREAHAAAGWNGVGGRVAGLKANASDLPPGQLDRLDHLESGRPEMFGRLMAGLHRDYGLRVLGGCCGTDARHIRAIAEQVRDGG